ncbi:hypothetical protein PR048_012278 [Dryococelus australis]|uniref:Uncharacterized protein n=1 Tax=Dryococelus australis TaxID=614101 RepID=A0ABQ9HPA7_9NEOP|nr:hypothetical protein PR048_012278 [Dryococelus australis]
MPSLLHLNHAELSLGVGCLVCTRFDLEPEHLSSMATACEKDKPGRGEPGCWEVCGGQDIMAPGVLRAASEIILKGRCKKNMHYEYQHITKDTALVVGRTTQRLQENALPEYGIMLVMPGTQHARRTEAGPVADVPPDRCHLNTDSKRAIRCRQFRDFCKQPSASLTSKLLTQAEWKYTIYEMKCSRCICAMEKFADYLDHALFTL